MWYESVAGMTRFSHETRCGPTSECACSCYRSRRKGEGIHKSVWECVVDVNLSVLNLVTLKRGGGEGYSWTDIYYDALAVRARKS